METRQLGTTGLQVSSICLGTMNVGSRLDEANSVKLLDRAFELSITFFDMGNIYPQPPGPETWGRTEEIFGRWVTDKRDDVVIATKCGLPIGPGPNQWGGSRKHIVEACEASLRRLNVERIDLLYLHNPCPTTPLDETVDAFDHLVDAGKICYFGFSNSEAWHLALAVRAQVSGGYRPIAATTSSFSMLRRSPERDLLRLAHAAGIGFVPYYAVAAGLLSGKFDRAGGLPPDYRLFRTFSLVGPHRGIDPERQVDTAFDVADAVREVATELGTTMTAVALAWVLSKSGVSSTIVGASRPEQLDDAIAASSLTLPQEAIDRLDAISFSFL
jgi:aryl-alcohol dehydrogenase-like predicted oxidoreductase